MGPVEAIKTCMRKSIDPSGRAPRSEFWWFAPIGLLPPVIFASQANMTKLEIYGIWKLLVVMMLAVPLISAASRRLHDIDHDGAEALYPFAPFFVLWIGYQLILWVGFALLHIGAAGITFLLWFIALLILLPMHLFVLFISCMFAASIIGEMLVSSTPGPNTYGPNPHEVTS